MLLDVALQERLVPALAPRRGLLLQHHELRHQDLGGEGGAIIGKSNFCLDPMRDDSKNY